MAHRYDLYGIRKGDLQNISCLIRAALDIQFSMRSSSYYAGEYYLYKESYGKEVRLYNNYDDSRGTWVRGNHKDFQVLLEVSDVSNIECISRKLSDNIAEIVLLSSEILPKEDE